MYAKAISFSKALFPYANPGKNAEIKVGEETFIRHAIRTHFIKAGEESYIDIVEEYAAPVYRDGDILFISEKIITLCQNRVVEKKELKRGFWSKFLCKFVYNSPYGFGIRSPYQESNRVCNEIKEKLGIDCVIADANDISIEILGWSKGIPYSIRQLRGMVKDNPSGQDREMTPLILVRERARLNGLELRMIHR